MIWPQKMIPARIVRPYRADCLCFGLLGASFHVLSTPTIFGVPVRVSLADVVLAIVLTIGGLRWIVKRDRLPEWNLSPAHVCWLVAMVAVLTASYYRGGMMGDAAATWALMKVVGLGVLIAYFVYASWFGLAGAGATARCGVKGFIAAAWVHAAYGLVQYGMYFFLDYKSYPRIAGLAENPNAYGIMLAAALALYWGSSAWGQLFNRRIEFWGTTLTLVALYLSASRSAYLGAFLAVAGLILFTNLEDRKVFRPAIAGVMLFVTVFVIIPSVPKIYHRVSQVVTGISEEGTYDSDFAFLKKHYAISRGHVDVGVIARMKLYEQAVEMWKEQPWLGAGLGAFWRTQQELADKAANVNHNTLLWLASEMGIVGIAVFGGAVLLACVTLARKARSLGVAGGALGMLLVLIGASAGTEVMYQRYAWFFCALALASVFKAKANACSRTTPAASTK